MNPTLRNFLSNASFDKIYSSYIDGLETKEKHAYVSGMIDLAKKLGMISESEFALLKKYNDEQKEKHKYSDSCWDE